MNTTVKEKWKKALRVMLRAYRRKKTDDKRSDLEILENLMEYFYKEGIVQKSEDGKFILPDIDGTIPRGINYEQKW